MRKGQIWSHYGDLLILVGLSFVAGVFVFIWPSPVGRVIAGSVLIFFTPGYLLLAALYPDSELLDFGQRFWVSFGLSVVVVGLLGLVIVFSIGVTLRVVYSVLLLWILAMALIATYRRHVAPPPKSFPGYALLSLAWMGKLRAKNWGQRAEAITILLIILAAGRLLWVSSRTVPQFTEFYLLGDDGALGNYPERVGVGEPVSITIGIVNHENEATPFALVYRLNDGEDVILEQLVLRQNERREFEAELSLPAEKGLYKVTLSLQKENESDPVQYLHVWLSVNDMETRIIQNHEQGLISDH